MSAATAAIISTDLLGGAGVELKDVMMICIPASLIAILVAAFVQNHIGKELEDDEVYKERVAKGIIDPEHDSKLIDEMIKNPNPRAKYAVVAFLLGVLILVVGKANVHDAVKGNVFGAGMNAMVAIFGIAWMGDTFFNGNLAFFKENIANVVTQYPFLFAIALFFMSIMLFSQAATVRTLYPLGIGLGIAPLALVAMFPAVNGYFFLPNYPTTVAAINFDRTGSTRIGRFVVNHSFQVAGFITTFVSIGVGYLIIQFM